MEKINDVNSDDGSEDKGLLLGWKIDQWSLREMEMKIQKRMRAMKIRNQRHRKKIKTMKL
ncbi:hypothetical protein EXN66_Car017650 [Channa argus]|uniref:Uncharacterized protein n=1 Tax=Channa argus TaxID=215402 RepID=A0A6G1QHD1_CHAAH|nr:hypothetical protein EXN66_Car017650 [Channa argus]